MLSRRRFIKLGSIFSLFSQYSFASNLENKQDFILFSNKIALMNKQIINDTLVRSLINGSAINKLVYQFKNNTHEKVIREIQDNINTEYTNSNTVLLNGFVYAPTEITVCLATYKLLKENNVIL